MLSSPLSLLSLPVDLSHFIICRVLGRGGFGKVQAVQRRSDDQYFAMKSITKQSLLRRTTQSIYMTWLERKVLSSFHTTLHPFLLHCNHAFQDGHTLYMVMPLMLGGDLRWYIKHNGPVKETDARFYACEILLALQHMHSLHLVYRDLKPDNVLLDSDGHIRLSDFGLCGRIRSGDGKTSGFCGTNGYIAPEVREGRRYDGSVDFYAFGVVLYELLTRYTPGRAAEERQRLAMEELMMGGGSGKAAAAAAAAANTKQRAAGAEQKQAVDSTSHTTHSQYDELFDPRLTYKRRGLSPACKDLLAGLLAHDPARRLGSGSVDKWEEVRRHEWFDGVDWAVAAAKQLKPPFVPNVNIANCDPVFELEEQIMHDHNRSNKNRAPLSAADQLLFVGWEYNTRLSNHGTPLDINQPQPLQGDELVVPVPAPAELQVSPEAGVVLGGGGGSMYEFGWSGVDEEGEVVMEEGVEVEMVEGVVDQQHTHQHHAELSGRAVAVDGVDYGDDDVMYATQAGDRPTASSQHVDNTNRPFNYDPRTLVQKYDRRQLHTQSGQPEVVVEESEPPRYLTQ